MDAREGTYPLFPANTKRIVKLLQLADLPIKGREDLYISNQNQIEMKSV